MAKTNAAVGGRAGIDFRCLNPECGAAVKFNLTEVGSPVFQAVCPKCMATYELDSELRGKLARLLNLVTAIRNAEDILGDVNVAVTTKDGELRIPYSLLLTRLNSIITLDFGGRKVDFHLWIEPSSPETFR
ncbi:MAG: hypothetical protein PHI85_01615 [Victivallaceae bacterium]|nr:hypothetical protein [Victivallaceae bacterium]